MGIDLRKMGYWDVDTTAWIPFPCTLFHQSGCGYRYLSAREIDGNRAFLLGRVPQMD